MTTDELDKLAPEQKQNRIAELQGWTEVKGKFGRTPDGSGVNYTPDYYNDLNATHEMEKMLTCEQMESYATWLCQIAVGIARGVTLELMNNESRCFALASATATQRADAFLLVMG